jgi:predicted nucleic acid-binding protein
LEQNLKLSLHKVNHAVQPVRLKLHFLGIEFWPYGHRLDKRMRRRITERANSTNRSSYDAILKHHASKQSYKRFVWDNVFRSYDP